MEIERVCNVVYEDVLEIVVVGVFFVGGGLE